MNSAQYFDIVVCPTIDNFLARPQDLRLALLSCVALVHIYDYLCADGFTRISKNKDFFKLEAADCSELWDLYEVAIAAKHVAVSVSGFSVAQVKPRAPAVWDEAKWDEAVWDDEAGGVDAARSSGSLRLELALPKARDYLLSKYPNLRQSSAP